MDKFVEEMQDVLSQCDEYIDKILELAQKVPEEKSLPILQAAKSHLEEFDREIKAIREKY